MAQRLANNSQLDTFRIVRLIGKGGMGEVYEAYEGLLNRKVALKIISSEVPDAAKTNADHIQSGEPNYIPEPPASKALVDSFINEGQALARINHPNVVTIYRLGYHQGIHYIAMEYVEGRSLKTLITRKEIEFDFALEIFEKIISGVKALHEKNIIHRDLKPKNILIDKESNVKIVDFGISEMQLEQPQSTQSSNKIVGSVYYIPPEVLRGAPATLKSDIWNLGVIFYEILTGRRPFEGESAEEIMRKAKDKDVKFTMTDRFYVPEAMQKLILRMCENLPQNRIGTLVDVDNELQLFKRNRSKSPAATKTYDGLQPDTKTYSTNLSSTRSHTKSHTKSHVSNSSGLNTSSRRNESSFSLQAKIVMVLLLLGGAYSAKYFNILKPSQSAKAIDRREASIPQDKIVTIVDAADSQSEQNEKLQIDQNELVAPIEIIKPIEATKITEVVDKPIEIQKPKPVVVQKNTPIARLSQVKLVNANSKVKLTWRGATVSRNISSVQNAIINSPVLLWKIVKNAKQYELQLAKDTEFLDKIIDTKLNTTKYKWQSSMPGKYYWRVRASGNDIETGLYSEVGELEVVLPSPSFARETYKTRSSAVTIGWSSVPLAEMYRVTVSDANNNARPIVDQISSDNSLSIEILRPGLYSARVMALTRDRQPASQYSAAATINFEKAMQLIQPKLNVPPSGIRVPNQGTIITPIIFNWALSSGATQYRLQLSRSPNFSQLIFDKALVENQYVLTDPLSSGAIYWRVRAEGKNEALSDWSEQRNFVMD